MINVKNKEFVQLLNKVVDVWLDTHSEEIMQELTTLQKHTYLEVDEEVLINAEEEIVYNRIVRYLKEIFANNLVEDCLEDVCAKIENKFNSISLI